MASRFWSAVSRLLSPRNRTRIHGRTPAALLSEPRLDIMVLSASAELLERQQELLPSVTRALGMAPYDYWITQRYHRSSPQCGPLQQSGKTVDAEWKWFFHGLECDIKNMRDGRFVRIDFGPCRNKFAFTSWGVMQFVMTSRPPWHSYEVLQSLLAEAPPPYDEYSGSDHPVRGALDRLHQQGLVGWADPELYEAVEANSVCDDVGNCRIQLPEHLEPDCSCDVFTCRRLVVTSKGNALAIEIRRAER